MKKITSLFILSLFLLFAGNAQSNYKQSIGLMAGNFSGVSYKLLHKKLAFQCDAGWRYMFASHRYFSSYLYYEEFKEASFYTFEINPNIMFQKNFKNQPSFIFIGLGGSLGYGKEISDYYGRDSGPKWGINLIFGVEYQFQIPLTVQLDFRPGYGKFMAKNTGTEIVYKDYKYYDWSFGLSVRYIIQHSRGKAEKVSE